MKTAPAGVVFFCGGVGMNECFSVILGILLLICLNYLSEWDFWWKELFCKDEFFLKVVRYNFNMCQLV